MPSAVPERSRSKADTQGPGAAVGGAWASWEWNLFDLLLLGIILLLMRNPSGGSYSSFIFKWNSEFTELLIGFATQAANNVACITPTAHTRTAINTYVDSTGNELLAKSTS